MNIPIASRTNMQTKVIPNKSYPISQRRRRILLRALKSPPNKIMWPVFNIGVCLKIVYP